MRRPRLRRSADERLEQPPGEAAPAEEGLRQWQPRLYLKLVLLFAVIAYAIAFVLENRNQVITHATDEAAARQRWTTR